MISIKQGDRRPAAPATIMRGEEIVDLTNATSVTFKMTERSEMALKVDAAASVLIAVNGTVEYRWAVGDTDTPGQYFAEWEVLWSDGTTETFPTVGTDVVIVYGDLDGRAAR
jgi:hypothetical protein